MKRAVLYLRVSKQEQTIENQRAELERVAAAKNWRIVGIFKDEGISGAFGREVRAQYDAMLKQGIQAKYDVVMAWDVSRLSRSLTELVTTLDELHACGIDLYLHQQALDTTTPAGKAMFQMCGVFAEFERGMLSERVKAGLRRAKEQGKALGGCESCQYRLCSRLGVMERLSGSYQWNIGCQLGKCLVVKGAANAHLDD